MTYTDLLAVVLFTVSFFNSAKLLDFLFELLVV